MAIPTLFLDSRTDYYPNPASTRCPRTVRQTSYQFASEGYEFTVGAIVNHAHSVCAVQHFVAICVRHFDTGEMKDYKSFIPCRDNNGGEPSASEVRALVDMFFSQYIAERECANLPSDDADFMERCGMEKTIS